VPAQVAAAVRAAGLPLLSMEATDVHFHAHLDIVVDGQQVAVPAEVGIAGQGAISSMHTHDSTGIIHIEAPSAATFTLGQFFTEWQVPLSSTCVNKVCGTGGESWRFYVDGQPYTGDPTVSCWPPIRRSPPCTGTCRPVSRRRTTSTFPAGL